MSNTVKIKNRKKKKEVKVNYKLWAIVFGIFVALIVAGAIWASFHWGVGMGTIGVRPVDPEDASAAATEAASEYATDGAVTLTPEMLEQMGLSVDDLQEAGAEGQEAGADGEAAAEGEAAEDGSAAEGAAEGDAASAEGDAAPAESDAAPAEGDAAPAESDAAPAEGDAAPAEGEAAGNQ